ncbi:MAG TPA: TIGR03943 family protein [Rugosimonospora sp.]|nr:TIGR03943 family protein [Rugosimonospora sp.]
MRRAELHAVVLLLAGGTLLKLALTGGYLRYVKAGLRPLLLAAAVVLLAVAVLSLVQAVRHRAGDHASGHGDDGHGHAHGRLDVAWLLVLPMLALLLIAPPALGSYSAARSGTALGAARTDLPPLPDGDPVRVSLLDYASRAVFDHGASLAGRHVLLSGFLLPGAHGGWYLTRMVITCCAADAQPIKVGLAGEVPAGVKSGQWLEVTGAYSPRTEPDAVNAETIPFVSVSASRPIPAPQEQYVS